MDKTLQEKAFQEEKTALEQTEQELDTIIDRYTSEADRLDKEITGFRRVDYEDRDVYLDMKRQQRSASESAEEYRSYKEQPYFGRIDLDEADAGEDDKLETHVYYIGETCILDQGDLLVVDWRDPMGSCYYAANQKKFNVEGQPYELALKRSLDIRKGKLVGCKTVYDVESVSLQGELVDPFLLEVLKDKRRKNRLTDIIRTIQANQNKIIRRPRLESFVVQGCAGSGKTMILLHRLSYLKFNHPNMNLAGIKILTPNHFFDAHIDALSQKLGLGKIVRLSAEEYYAELMRAYDKKAEISVETANERELGQELLSFVYSDLFQKRLIDGYHAYWVGILEELKSDRLQQYFEKYHQKWPDFAVHTATTYKYLSQGIQTVQKHIREAEQNKNRLEERYRKITQSIEKMRAEQQTTEPVLTALAQQIKAEIAGMHSPAFEKDQEYADRLLVCDEKLNKTARRIEYGKQEIQRLRESLAQSKRDMPLYQNYRQFTEQSGPQYEAIKASCADVIAEIEQKRDEYRKTPIYHIARKINMRRIQRQLEEQFGAEVGVYYEQLFADMAQAQQKAESDVSTQTEEQERLLVHRRNLREEREPFRKIRAAVELGEKLFAETQFPDIQALLQLPAYEDCGEILLQYEKVYRGYHRLEKRVAENELIKGQLLVELEDAAQALCSPEDVEYLEHCGQRIAELKRSSVDENVFERALKEAYSSFGQPYTQNNYRHKIYLKLLLFALYYPPLLNTDTFVNIDEAQDLAAAEYKLLKRVLGDRCVFNLYGDTKQNVYSYKGITNWNKLQDITGGRIYTLNENYRNTLQITNFCNSEFSAQVYPIGISGEPVVQMAMEQAVQWAVQLKKEKPDYRIAVIYRYGAHEVKAGLKRMFGGSDIAWNLVDDAKISIIPVEMAKGLEFEAVAAIVSQMTDNERYVSYTRALEQLAVVDAEKLPPTVRQ